MGENKLKIKNEKLKIKLAEIPWGKIRLLLVLLWLLGIQVQGFWLPKSEFEKAKERVMKNPKDLEVRLVLAEELLGNNQLKEAEKELIIASQLQQNSYPEATSGGKSSQFVMGKQVSKLEELILQKQENDPEDLERLIQQWLVILKQKPNYRDGWLKLALYLIKVGKISEAQKAWERAKELDPNYEVVEKLEELLLQGNKGN